MKSVKNTDSLGRRLKRVFSREDKQRFCSEWENSGLSKFQFCKKKGLSPSAFSLWCRKFFDHKGKTTLKKGWVPLVQKDTSPKSSDLISFEIKLPNGMIFNTSFEPAQFLSFLKNLSNATTAIW